LALENKKQLFIIVGALAAGLVAVILTSRYVTSSIQSQTASLAEQYNDKQKEMASKIQQRSDQQLAAMAQELDRVKRQQAESERKQLDLIQQAQQAAKEQLAAQAELKVKPRKPSLALKTPAGKRAVPVMIDSLSAVGGMLNAGDFVDVIAQLNVPGDENSDKKTVTAMVFQDLQVLAVNTNINDPGAYDEQQAGSLRITLAVDPQEAGLLSFANKNGTLQLVLRSPDENEHQATKADTWKTLTDYVMKDQGYDIKNPDGEATVTKPAGNKPNIQIFRGGKEL
jgi:pilus assembly protein CpaB